MNIYPVLFAGALMCASCCCLAGATTPSPVDEIGTAIENKDYGRAFELLGPLAEAGNEEAEYELGYLYEHGFGVQHNFFDAARWYRRAGTQLDDNAKKALAIMYFEGRGTPQDRGEAIRWLNSFGYKDPQCYPEVKNTTSGSKENVENAKAAADRGNPDMEYYIGQLVMEGTGGFSKDPVGAIKWYRAAAAQGNEAASLQVIGMYFSGEGVPRDYTLVKRELEALANKGSKAARCQLGALYENGLGTRQDTATAVKFYRDVAEIPAGTPIDQETQHASRIAAYRMGVLYERGGDAVGDLSEAAVWYRKAAEGGLPEAQSRLGIMYATGKGVAQNYDEAAKLLQPAAAAGLSDAQVALGRLYVGGHGVGRDLKIAYKWFTLAARYPKVMEDRDIAFVDREAISGLMTPRDMEAAEELVREFQ